METLVTFTVETPLLQEMEHTQQKEGLYNGSFH